jgi:hypothetical protein
MFRWFRKVDPDELRDLRKAVVQLREDVDDLEAKHERLRGRFYERVKPGVRSGGPARPESKQELLARYFVPGRPAVHPSTPASAVGESESE